MADKNLTPWEGLVLEFTLIFAKEADDGVVSRTVIQRVQPDLANLLKKHKKYKIGKTPEKTVDKIIQDLEKKGFLEMLFRRGGERGLYEVNITEAEQALKKWRAAEVLAIDVEKEIGSDRLWGDDCLF